MKYDFKLNINEEERAAELHKESIVIDIHSHPVIIGAKRDVADLERLYYLDCSGRALTNYEGLKKSGITSYFDGFGTARKVIPLLPQTTTYRDWSTCIDNALWRLADMRKHSDSLIIAYKAEDVVKAKNEDKIAMFMTVEGLIGEEFERVTYLYGLGVRMMGLTHSSSNCVGGGCNDRRDSGLTFLGEALVKEMNELGMIVDLAHCGRQTALDAIEVSKCPCVFSHAACKSVYASLKAKSDEEIQALAEKGGVIGIQALPNVLASGSKQTIEDVLKHIEYAVNLVGVDHVGVGTDVLYGNTVALHKAYALYTGTGEKAVIEKRVKELEAGTPYMYGIEDHDDWPNITRGLVTKGYSDQEIQKIIGKNALGLMEKILK